MSLELLNERMCVQVWRGGEVSRFVPGQVVVDSLRDITDDELLHKTFGEPLEEPLLGHHFVLPKRPDRAEPITLDQSLFTVSNTFTKLKLILQDSSDGYFSLSTPLFFSDSFQCGIKYLNRFRNR